MTQKDKELLWRDLCARLPYGVKIQVNDKIETVEGINILDNIVEFGTYMACDIEEVKPYLFPMSSMTVEKGKEFAATLKYLHAEKIDIWTLDTYDWCNKNNFDYRGLIPKGLANDATGLNIY